MLWVMPTFPSGEWMDAFCANLRAHPGADDMAAALQGTYRLVIEPAGPLAERHTYDVEILPGPAGAEVAWTAETGPAPPTLSLTAGYDRWQQLIRGELDIAMALMLRRVRVGGDLSRLTRQIDSARPLLDALRGVETQWLT